LNNFLELRSPLQTFLQEFSNERVLFIPNQGNAGDCLIMSATLEAMKTASIEIEIADERSNLSGQTVFLGGGGNLVGLYRGMRECLEVACDSQATRIVLLPHTVRANEDLIARLDSRMTLWCREERSFEHVRRVNPSIDCRLGHDMAFHLDAAEFLNDAGLNRVGPEYLRNSLELLGTNLDQISHLKVAKFMRTDREARPSMIVGDIDVSKAFGSVADIETSRLRAWCFLKTISVSPRVMTDRLHVAISCSMLGKECELLDNSYSKNRDIYFHSLQRFPCMSFKKSGGKNVRDFPEPRRSLFSRISRHARHFAQTYLPRSS
jgi:exopolysaccharide biosynthesis predicted pyruvyltransferase EpsI